MLGLALEGGVAGTSIGAVNGAVIAQGYFEAGYNLWESMDASLQVQKLINRKIDRKVLVYLSLKIKDIIENKGFDMSRMKKGIRRYYW